MTQDRNFHKSCQKYGDKVGENPAAGAAYRRFLAIREKPQGGGGVFKHPPAGQRLNVIR